MKDEGLLKINSEGRIGGKIIEKEVDEEELVDDEGGRIEEEINVVVVEIRSNEVKRSKREKGEKELVSEEIKNKEKGMKRKKKRERMKDRIIEERIEDLIKIDWVRLEKDLKFIESEEEGKKDRKKRKGERMKKDEDVRKKELIEEKKKIIIEKIEKRIKKMNINEIRKKEEIMVRIDSERRKEGKGKNLDKVRIKSKMKEEIREEKFNWLLIEKLDKKEKDGIEIILRVNLEIKREDEEVGRIKKDKRKIVMIEENLKEMLKLVFENKEVIKENECKLIEERLMRKKWRKGRIKEEWKREDKIEDEEMFEDRIERMLEIGKNSKEWIKKENEMKEIMKKIWKVRSVKKLRMEMKEVIFEIIIRNKRVGRIRRSEDDGEEIRKRGKKVEMDNKEMMEGEIGKYEGKERNVLMKIEKRKEEIEIMEDLKVEEKMGENGMIEIKNEEKRNKRIKNRMRRKRRKDIGSWMRDEGKDKEIRMKKIERIIRRMEGKDLEIEIGIEKKKRNKMSEMDEKVDDKDCVRIWSGDNVKSIFKK